MRVCPRCKAEYPDDVTICSADGSQTRPKGAPQAAAADPLLGRMVGSYRLTKQLGKGGMGAVYQGEHPAIGSKVAVKFLHPQYAQMNEVVTRFFNEAKAVNLIKHDNIVQVVDYFYLDDEMPCFIMEFLDRGYAMSKLAGRPHPLELTGPIFMQVCDALQAAHDKRIIHRDLKPDNIFLAVRNYRKHFVKIMDFGIAKLAATGESSDSNTQMGQVLGTPTYMSPEQASGKVDLIGPGSDIYSLGIIMYQLAVGRVPYRGAMGEIIAAHLKDTPTPPRQENPSITPEYEAIILKALAKKPEERWASMRDLGQAIAALMRAQGLSLELPPDDGDSTSDFAPSVSFSPFPTREGGRSGPADPTMPRPGTSTPTAAPPGAAAPDAGATSYPNRGPAAPVEAAGSSYPNLAAARTDAEATSYPNRSPSGGAAPVESGPTTYPPRAPSGGAPAPDPIQLTGSSAATVNDVAGETLPPTRPPPAATRAAVPSAPPAPAPPALARPAAAPAVAAPVATAASSSSMRWVVAGVAFALGVGAPIALVKGGVISVHAKK